MVDTPTPMSETVSPLRPRGSIIWLTGLSGAGKDPTLASALSGELRTRGLSVGVLDADSIRMHLASELGFTKDHRDINVRRIGFVARLLASHGVLVVVAAISPYSETRGEVRRSAEQSGITFLEVFVTAPLQTLISRDVKGLYRKALAGEIRSLYGHLRSV